MGPFFRAIAAYSKVVRQKKSSSAEGTRGRRAREGGLFPSRQGGLGGGGLGGLPQDFFLNFGRFFVGFNAFGTRFQSFWPRFFC